MRDWFTRGRLVALVVLLAVALGAVVADSVLRRYVEGRIESEVGEVADGRVDAQVVGRPATWFVLRDEYPTLEGRVDGAVVPVRGEDVRVDLDVVAHDVNGLAGGAPHVGSGTGRASIEWEELSRATGADLSGTADGRLVITTEVGVLGERLPVRVSGRPIVDGATGQLGLGDAKASLDAVDVPQDVVDGLLPRVATYAYLPTFEGLRWGGVQVTQEGAELDFRVDDLQVPQW